MSEYRADGIGLGQRLKHAWNAFIGRDQQIIQQQDLGPSYFVRQDRVPFHRGVERTIISSIYTRIAIDVSSVKIQHARLDENERYIGAMDSGLNYCMTVEANIDQTARDFFQDLVESMCDEGVVAAVPVEATVNPRLTGSYDIKCLRVARITQWFPKHVKVNLWNEATGKKEDLILPKGIVAIVQNPLYNVMNEPNSTLRRLIHKLNLLDVVDEQASSGKLDLIVHLPYMTRTAQKKQEAENRRLELEHQLAASKYGVAYTDAAEKITQLNRPVENNLLAQVESLTSMLYSQLGMTKEVFEGTADEKTMLNYFSRTIEPIVSAITDEFNRKFLTKTARTQHQKIVYFRDLFKLAPVESIVALGSQFAMNEIMTPNEVRQLIGFKPALDPGADELRNRNINASPGLGAEGAPTGDQNAGPAGNIADMTVSEIDNYYNKEGSYE